MKKAIVVFSLMFTAVAGTLTLTEGRLYAMRVYGAPCGPASGFAGFLQKTHFLPTGTCKFTNNVCNSGAACTVTSPVSGAKSSGTCGVLSGNCSCIIQK